MTTKTLEKTQTEAKEETPRAQRTKCEVYSRVVGYIRPVQQWNDGKQAEYADRKTFSCEC
jgi:anaerobic ribonucleoside-triphosphate reductase